MVLVAYIVTPDLTADDANWQGLVIFACIPNIIPLIFGWLLPESPYILANRGSFKECKDTFNKIFDCNKQPQLTEEENRIIDNFVPTEQHGIWKLYTKKYIKTTLLLKYLWFAKGFVGYGILYILPQTLGTEEKAEVVQDFLIAIIIMWIIGAFVIFTIDVPFLGRKNSSLLFFILASITLGICIFSVPNDVFVYLVGMGYGFS